MPDAFRFTWPIGDGTVLIPRTPALADEFHALLAANHDRLARWSPGLTPPTPEATRAALERAARAWLDGSRLPLAVATRSPDGYRLAGVLNLTIGAAAGSAEVGFWLDAAAEGRGLITRALTAVLGHAFGERGLHRVEMRTLTGNERTHRLADRFGFRREAVLRAAAAFPDGRRDVAVYGLLAREFTAPATPAPAPAPAPA